MTTAEILNAAADLIEPEGAWTQEEEARNADGRGVTANDPTACAWCASGALNKVSDDDCDYADAWGSFYRFLDEGVRLWNDREGRTQAEVVQVLRAAAKDAS